MSLAVADYWYDVEVLSKDVTWIDELHVHRKTASAPMSSRLRRST
ncbi:MAG: hypothetical protein OSA01_14025 [Arenicellales bacterium]|jgi:hypothetical protein|nr:hypothetical protein [Arenicellales bacterium]